MTDTKIDGKTDESKTNKEPRRMNETVKERKGAARRGGGGKEK